MNQTEERGIKDTVRESVPFPNEISGGNFPQPAAGPHTKFLNPKEISPRRFYFITIVAIFFAEIIAMIVIYDLQWLSYWQATLLDALIMIVIISPIVYNLLFRSLLKEMSERKRSESLLSKILEILPTGVGITDKNGLILYGNPAIQKIWAGERIVGIEKYGVYKGWWVENGELIEGEDWAVARAIQNREISLNEEVEIECFDGTHKFILNSALPILNEKGDLQGAITVNQDITQRRQMEENIIQTNELLERIFFSIDTLIAYMDRDFNFLRVNDTYARATGHSPEYFIGKNHFTLSPNEENEIIFRRVVETGEPFSVFEKPFEYGQSRERGVTYWDWSLQPVKGTDGAVDGLVLSLVDVTERKRAELQLEQQNRELLELSKAERRQRELAENLSEATQAITQALDLDQRINRLLDFIHGIVPSDTAGVALLQGKFRMVTRVMRGPEEWAKKNFPFAMYLEVENFPELHAMISQHRSLLVEDSADYMAPDIPNWFREIRSWLVTPIIASEKVIGIVGLGQLESGYFTLEHQQWVETLVRQAGVAIQNAWLFEQVRASSERLQSLTRKLVEIQESERYHVARELHDEAGQALSSLKLGLGRLEQDSECSPHLRQRLAELRDLTDSVMEELHRLAMDLRPVALDHLGLVAALEQYAKNLNSERLSVKFKPINIQGERLPLPVETSLYRIVQEALTNILRHAQAHNVGILLEQYEGTVVLSVEDDGIGFDPDQIESGKRLGLVGMRERAEMLDGSLTIESSPGAGTTVIVEVPDGCSNPDRG